MPITEMTLLSFPFFLALKEGGLAVANDYRVRVRISVTQGEKETLISSEERLFDALSFHKMTRAASEYYELLAKIVKAVK